MENLIELVEKSIKEEQWNVNYHQTKLDTASNNLQLLKKQLIELKNIKSLEDEVLQRISNHEL